MNNPEVNPCIVILDGNNKPFRSYINCDVANLMIQKGMKNFESLTLRETEDRRVPESLKQGMSMITDVWITLTPNPRYEGTI